jgi:hypothetical protein
LPPMAAQQVRFLLEGKFVDRQENVLVFTTVRLTVSEFDVTF